MGRFLAITLFAITVVALAGAAVIYQKGVQYENDNKKLSTKVSELEGKLKTADKAAADKVAAAVKAKDAAEAKVKKLTADLTAAQTKISGAEKATADAKKELEDVKKQLETAKAEKDEAQKAAEAVKADLEKTKAELEKAKAENKPG